MGAEVGGRQSLCRTLWSRCAGVEGFLYDRRWAAPWTPRQLRSRSVAAPDWASRGFASTAAVGCGVSRCAHSQRARPGASGWAPRARPLGCGGLVYLENQDIRGGPLIRRKGEVRGGGAPRCRSGASMTFVSSGASCSQRRAVCDGVLVARMATKSPRRAWCPSRGLSHGERDVRVEGSGSSRMRTKAPLRPETEPIRRNRTLPPPRSPNRPTAILGKTGNSHPSMPSALFEPGPTSPAPLVWPTHERLTTTHLTWFSHAPTQHLLQPRALMQGGTAAREHGDCRSR